jgi:hypothetical protein
MQSHERTGLTWVCMSLPSKNEQLAVDTKHRAAAVKADMEQQGKLSNCSLSLESDCVAVRTPERRVYTP